jgi:hypothetical protein
MTLRAGKLENGQLTTGSMAEAIELALRTLIPLHAGEDPVGRQKVALAIAQGVLTHLKDNASSIKVTVPNRHAGQSTHEQSATIAVEL